MELMNLILLAAIGLGAGILSAVCGVGGGIVVVPALLWLTRFGIKDIKTAVGTSLAFIVPTAAWGAYRKAPAGQVDWKVAAILAVGGIVGATLGAWISDALPAAWIKKIFAIVLVGVAIQLFRDA
jgi:uncharacterized protein